MTCDTPLRHYLITTSHYSIFSDHPEGGEQVEPPQLLDAAEVGLLRHQEGPQRKQDQERSSLYRAH